MFQLDTSIHEQVTPIAWLLGRWEGAGVLGYPTIDSAHFGQEVTVTHDGRPFLAWESRSWLLAEDGTIGRPLAREFGFWRVVPDGAVELLLTHPTGIVEMYYGTAEPAKISLTTDGVLRSPHAKEYNSATRLYGLVNSNLMWAMDMAAVGLPLQSHLSAELRRME